VFLAYFVWNQVHAEHPFVNLRIFKSVQFSIGNLIGVISGFGLYGLNFVTPLFFQGPLKLSAYDAGLYLLPGSLATAASMLVAGELNRRFDSRVIIASGLEMFAAGAWWMGCAQRGRWLPGRDDAAPVARLRAGPALRAACAGVDNAFRTLRI
jgi:hypothetical protein